MSNFNLKIDRTTFESFPSKFHLNFESDDELFDLTFKTSSLSKNPDVYVIDNDGSPVKYSMENLLVKFFFLNNKWDKDQKNLKYSLISLFSIFFRSKNWHV